MFLLKINFYYLHFMMELLAFSNHSIICDLISNIEVFCMAINNNCMYHSEMKD